MSKMLKRLLTAWCKSSIFTLVFIISFHTAMGSIYSRHSNRFYPSRYVWAYRTKSCDWSRSWIKSKDNTNSSKKAQLTLTILWSPSVPLWPASFIFPRGFGSSTSPPCLIFAIKSLHSCLKRLIHDPRENLLFPNYLISEPKFAEVLFFETFELIGINLVGS